MIANAHFELDACFVMQMDTRTNEKLLRNGSLTMVVQHQSNDQRNTAKSPADA